MLVAKLPVEKPFKGSFQRSQYSMWRTCQKLAKVLTA